MMIQVTSSFSEALGPSADAALSIREDVVDVVVVESVANTVDVVDCCIGVDVVVVTSVGCT